MRRFVPKIFSGVTSAASTAITEATRGYPMGGTLQGTNDFAEPTTATTQTATSEKKYPWQLTDKEFYDMQENPDTRRNFSGPVNPETANEDLRKSIENERLEEWFRDHKRVEEWAKKQQAEVQKATPKETVPASKPSTTPAPTATTAVKQQSTEIFSVGC